MTDDDLYAQAVRPRREVPSISEDDVYFQAAQTGLWNNAYGLQHEPRTPEDREDDRVFTDAVHHRPPTTGTSD